MQTQPLNNVDLRPLGIGEILDRAIVLIVRNWIPFIMVGAIGVMPGELVQFYAQWARNPPLAPLGTIVAGLGGSAATMATGLLVARAYAGEPLDWRSALARGFSKIPSAILIGIILFLVFVVPFAVPAGLAVWIFIVAGRGMGALLTASPFALVGFAVAAYAFLVQYTALNAASVEGIGGNDAFTHAFRLIYAAGFRKALGFALAMAIVVFGGSLFAGFVAGLTASLLHGWVVEVLIETALMLPVALLGDACGAIYYFDLRIRHEGYDLERALDVMPVRAQ